MSKWYKNSYRRTLLDMHIEDWDEAFMKEFDPDQYFEDLKKAHITAPMIYVQSHVGLCYYPTKVGDMHKGFVGNEDKMRRLFRMCNDAGMDTIAYYSLIFNNRAYEHHPEWRMRDQKGRGSRDFGIRYGLCCPNNEEYRAFVKEQIKEICEYFDFKGFFFDMTFWPEVCYCDSCKKKWEEKYHEPMPEYIDWKEEKWLALQKEREDWIGEFARIVTDEVKRYKPEVSVEHQFCTSLGFWRFGVNENIAKASDYIGTNLEVYGGIKQQSFACKAWYNLTQDQPFQYMTARCFPLLSEHTSTKSEDQLMQGVAMTSIHHGASLIIDGIDPVGTVDDRVYDLIGRVYAKTEKLEKYFDHGKMDYDVSLYFNLDNKMNVNAERCHVMDHKAARDAYPAGTMPHFEALRGAADTMVSEHIPFGVINNWKKEEMFRHKVLVLADIPKLTEEELMMIEKYIQQGGNVYISGLTAPTLVKKIFGLKLNGYTEETVTYMSPTDKTKVMDGLFNWKYPLVMFEKAVLAEGEVKGEVLATLTKPYTIPGIPGSQGSPTDVPEENYIDVNGPRYPFVTIHSNPPGKYTDIPAMVKAGYGKGTVIWSCLPIEKADRYQHNRIFANILRELCGNDLLFEADASESVEIVVFDAPEYHQKLIGIVETRPAFKIPDTTDLRLRVRTENKPKRVINLVKEEEVPFTYQDGKVELEIARMSIFTMLSIEY